MAPVVWDMALTPDEFFARLPAALEGRTAQATSEGWRIHLPQGSVALRVSPLPARRIGGLSLPRSEVRFEFENLAADQAQGFLDRVALHYRRGGG